MACSDLSDMGLDAGGTQQKGMMIRHVGRYCDAQGFENGAVWCAWRRARAEQAVAGHGAELQ